MGRRAIGKSLHLESCVLILGSFFSLFTFHFSLAQKVGLVLSGGGARGLAHIGVIKALEENHIPIDFIAGTSSGAIVGSMYAQGFTPAQMDSIVNTDDFYNWATGTLDKDYTYYFRKKDDNASWITLKFSVDSIIQTTLPTNIVNSAPVDFALMENTAAVIAKAKYNFDSLFIPFRCVAADIENKRTEIFRKGDLGQAVRASAAYPFYFKPVIIDGRFLYDGGMYNNFPADVMLNEFQPDIIIGVNAAGTNAPTTEGNIISQIRTMMTTPTNFSVLCDNGIMINVPTDKIGLFDFTSIPAAIEAGYKEAQSRMKDIKYNIQRRVDPKVVAEKRKSFRADLPNVMVDNVIMEGVTGRQSEYVWNILKPDNKPIPLSRLKSSYFQLVADENIRSIYPTLKYNDSTRMFDLHLRIKRESDLITQFGGDISSRPITEAFIGAQYNIWRRYSYSFYTGFYFGKLYTAGQLKVRMDAPGHFPYFLETDITLNQYDFFKSSTAFFTDEKPSYIIKSDYNFGLDAGIPIKNKSKLVIGSSYVHLQDHYYQTNNFVQTDTADETLFDGGTAFLLFERSTLNKKMYANQGSFFSMKLRFTKGVEFTVPGSTSVDRIETNNDRQWTQFKLIYDDYFKSKGRLRFGFYGEGVMSNEPFFSNYTSTVLTAPAFEPLNEMKTLYLPNFYAHQYLGAGSKNVVMIRSNFDFRLEAYIFQPYQELLRTPDLKTEYGKPWAKQYYIGSAGAVFHSPIGPVSLFVNYYHDQKNPFSLLFHFGYIIFNKSAIE